MEGYSYLVSKAKTFGFIKDEKEAHRGEKYQDPYELFDKLAKLPFWCYDDFKHETNPEYHKDFCCLTHVVGLPKHPATRMEMPLTPYQVEFVNSIISETTQPANSPLTKAQWDSNYHMFHINKGRQMGFTEIVLRLIQYFCFSRYAGQNVGIMAATNGELANKDLRRFQRLFNRIRPVVKQPIKNRKMIIHNTLHDTETVVQAFPASEEAATGDTDYAAFFMDESAKWKLVDDTPVFNSILPIIRSNGADLFAVSTPKGPLKMFYKIHKDPEDFIKLEYNIWRAEGTIYTKEKIEHMLATSKEDPNQEYLCKFTIGQDSILGVVEDDDRANFKEWDEEDDSYVEEGDDDDSWS
jgi:hypothetical protein